MALLGVTACGWLPGTDANTITKAQTAIAQELIDPSSPQFRNLFVGSRNPLTVCGEINGKNRMGAYAGFSRFMVVPQTNLRIVENDPNGKTGDPEHDAALAQNTSLFELNWSLSCKKDGQ